MITAYFPAHYPADATFTISNYASTTWYKNGQSLCTQWTNGSTVNTYIMSINYQTTAAITSASIFDIGGGNLIVGSTFTIGTN